MLLTSSLAHTPPEVIAKNTGLSLSEINAFPRNPLYIFPGEVPPSLDVDKANIGLENVSDSQFTFRLKAMEPTKSSKAGEVRIVDPKVFPLSTHIVGALVTLKPGALRELHWHPHASEWQFWIAGKARMTVFFHTTMRERWTSTRMTWAMSLQTLPTTSRTRETQIVLFWNSSRRISSGRLHESVDAPCSKRDAESTSRHRQRIGGEDPI